MLKITTQKNFYLFTENSVVQITRGIRCYIHKYSTGAKFYFFLARTRYYTTLVHLQGVSRENGVILYDNSTSNYFVIKNITYEDIF